MEFRSKQILLTGATGVLGVHLLKVLLTESSADVYCIVRASDQPSAKLRIFSTINAYGITYEDFEKYLSRIHLILGDISLEYFGLDQTSYHSLTSKIDFTIHAAASTNLFLKFSMIEASNVFGVKNVIDFCLLTNEKKLCYISTYTVLGNKIFDRTFIFKEKHLDVGQDFPFMSYQQSKFVSETLIHDAKQMGLNYIIVRPGQIFGESQTGYYPQGQTNVSGLFMDIFKTVLETGIAINSVAQFDITPVDYVSHSIIYLALVKESFDETFHLANPHVIPYAEIVGILKQIGYSIDLVSEEKYKNLLLNKTLYYRNSNKPCNSSTVKAFRWWFNRNIFSFTNSAVVDSTYTATILKDAQIECPKIDQALLNTYVKHNIENGYFPKS